MSELELRSHYESLVVDRKTTQNALAINNDYDKFRD